MEHVVFFPGPDAPAFRRFASRDEAVQFVEQLRNIDGVSDISMFAMTPVPIVVRTYYRVEVPAAEDAMVPAVPEQPMPGPVAAVASHAPADAATQDGWSDGSDDAHSIGFFAH